MNNKVIMTIAASLMFVLSACSDDVTLTPSNGPSVQAEVFTVTPRMVSKTYTTSGIITSDHRVAVSSRLSGYIKDMFVHAGQNVKQGDVLFRVDPVDTRQALEQARAELADARTDLDRFRSLLKQQAVTQQQFDKVQLRYKVASSRVAQAENQLGYAEVKAPVDGVIVEKRMDAGDLASPSMPIVTLENPSQLSVETYISEQFILYVHEGDDAVVRLSSISEPFTAKVRQVVQAADANSHKFFVKASLNANHAIRPGMFAELTFHVGERQTLMIPRSAVISRQGLHGVYVVDAEGVMHYRLIRLGLTEGDWLEVASGLNAGDQIVKVATDQLVTGTRIVQGH